MADIDGQEAKVIGQGKVACMIIGNRISQVLAGQEIENRCGKVDEKEIDHILVKVSSSTPSVSPEHLILTTEVMHPDPSGAVLEAFLEDCRKRGWRLCDPQ